MRKAHRVGELVAAPRSIAEEMAKRAKGPGKPTMSEGAKENVRHAVEEAVARSHGKQTVLAERLGTRQSVVSDWKNGKSSPALKSIEELADFLGWRVAEVLEGGAYPLENCIAYWGRDNWPRPVIAEARRRAMEGEKRDAQGWKLVLDELKAKHSRR